ncbi:putative conserved secreted protein [Synechococcus sp. A15-60]|nr:putative conserved secreted protein [Synechococcus sp. A15-60]
MADPSDRSSSSADPRWFVLLMASRWPLAVALAAWAVAVAAIQILRQPIPIGLPLSQPLPVQLVGGITVDQLTAPVRVKGEEPLMIQAAKTLPVAGDVAVPKGVAVSEPVQVEGDVALSGPVTVNEVTQPVMVHGEDGEALMVATPDGERLNVYGGVKVDSVGGKISVQLRDAAKSLLPIP